MSVKIVAIGSQKAKPPGTRHTGGLHLCLLALGVVIKPLAQVVGNDLRYDGHENVG